MDRWCRLEFTIEDVLRRGNGRWGIVFFENTEKETHGESWNDDETDM